jgi:hypothetical protein
MVTYFICSIIAVVTAGVAGFAIGAKHADFYKQKLAKVEGEIKAVENKMGAVGYELLRFVDRIRAHL